MDDFCLFYRDNTEIFAIPTAILPRFYRDFTAILDNLPCRGAAIFGVFTAANSCLW